jgi:hypothetical protein
MSEKAVKMHDIAAFTYTPEIGQQSCIVAIFTTLNWPLPCEQDAGEDGA